MLNELNVPVVKIMHEERNITIYERVFIRRIPCKFSFWIAQIKTETELFLSSGYEFKHNKYIA